MAMKKSDAEKRATRRAAKARYRAKKTEAGLKQISIWVPQYLIDEAEKIGKLVGVIYADDNNERVVMLAKKESGLWDIKKR